MVLLVEPAVGDVHVWYDAEPPIPPLLGRAWAGGPIETMTRREGGNFPRA